MPKGRGVLVVWGEHIPRQEITMPTAYVRRVNLKSSLSDAEVVAFWRFTMEEAVPSLQRVPGMAPPTPKVLGARS